MDYIIKDGELQHHGILGQKWGVRRFQNKDGSLTTAGKKRITRKQKKALEKARQAKRDKAEAAKKAKQEQEDFEAGKKRAIESGSATDVLKYKGKLTNQELQQAVARINMEKTLKEISAKETKTGLDKAESFMNKVDRVNKMATKGIDAYNTIAKVLNSTAGTDLPSISNDAKKKSDKVTDSIKKETKTAIKKEAKKAAKEEKKAAKEEKKAERDNKPTIKRSPDEYFTNKGDSDSGGNKPVIKRSADEYFAKNRPTIKRNVSDLKTAKWVKKESDKILEEIKNDHISNYGHRQDIVDAVNRYIEELDR